MGKILCFEQVVLGQLGVYMQNLPQTSKSIISLSVKHKTTKVFEESIENLHNFELVKEFLNMILNNKFDFIKILSFPF